MRSSLTMTIVTPAGPTFFCAPAQINPNLVTSTSSERIFYDISATRGTSPVSGM